ncbi:ATP-binding protein [Desulfitobacterium sp. Sab5]|uniref:ATP-binding protein n=1 Tax=Desulfitobacterium nosdiversum TaxID=3375356 RepID=UPI003CF77440
MNIEDFISSNPDLQQILMQMHSKLFDILPCGISIAADAGCKTIIHNSVTARFLRIEPLGQFSFSTQGPHPMKVYQNGKMIPAEELPIEQAVRFGKEIVGCELEFVWEDGITKFARWNASPIRDNDGIIRGCIATMGEITDYVHKSRKLRIRRDYLEKLVEERTSELRKSEERFSKIFHSSPNTLMIVRKSDFRLIDVNQRALKNSTFSRENLIGNTLFELGMPEAHFLQFKDKLEENSSIENMEFSFLRNENEVTYLLSAEKMELDNEECFLLTRTNITKNKQVEKEMARLDRLNLVGKMAAGIAHEIRNPMTTVRGYLQVMGAKTEFKSYSSAFGIMMDEIDHANSIITKYLSLACHKPNNPSYQNIDKILDDLYPLLRAEASKQQKEVVLETMDTPKILLNANEIVQLTLNLAQNGLDAMKENGRLSVRTYTQDEQVVLSVKDEGTGIPRENIEKLGIPFFTTKDNHTGLGLATSYNIVHRHHGKFKVQSGSGGTEFLVYFPIK